MGTMLLHLLMQMALCHHTERLVLVMLKTFIMELLLLTLRLVQMEQCLHQLLKMEVFSKNGQI